MRKHLFLFMDSLGLDSSTVISLVSSVNDLNLTLKQFLNALGGGVCAYFLWWRLFY